MGDPAAIRDFLLAFEKALITRRLYAHTAPASLDAVRRVWERSQAALAHGDLTLSVGATEVQVERTAVFTRPSRQEFFFFPLYRDGIRELIVHKEIPERELVAFMTVFEADEKKALGSDEDCVSFLWRLNLSCLGYNAVDVVGEAEEEAEAAGQQSLEGLARAMAERMKDAPASPGGRSSGFVMDGTVHIGETDLHFETTTVHRSFELNPLVFGLTPEEVAGLREEAGRDNEPELLADFLEALFAVLGEPVRPMAGPALASLFRRLLEGYWTAGDFEALCRLLSRLGLAAQSVPNPDNRTAARDLIEEFLGPERLAALFERVQAGSVALRTASAVWDLAGERAWDSLVAFAAAVGDGPVRRHLTGMLEQRMMRNPELLRGTLRRPEPERLRIALQLLPESFEPLYASEILALTRHPDEGIRLKGLAAAGRNPSRSAREAVWKAVEADPAKPVRLLGFRLLGFTDLPNMGQRLKALVRSGEFADRPLWEREKYVRLLALTEGEAIRPLFESWIRGRRRWLLVVHDPEKLELGLHGMVYCGRIGAKRVQELAAQRGRVAEAARRALLALGPQVLEEAMKKTEPLRLRPDKGMDISVEVVDARAW